MHCTIRLPVRLLAAPVLAAALATATLAAGQAAPTDQPQVVVVQVESKEKRLHYLATAQIWADPGDLTPQALLPAPACRWLGCRGRAGWRRSPARLPSRARRWGATR
jgi:hypothetical protein